MQYSVPVKLLMLMQIDEDKRKRLDEVVALAVDALDLSNIAGLPVRACGDIIRNQVNTTGKSRRAVVSKLKYKISIGKKIHV